MEIVAQKPVSIAKAFSPGHITGLFATSTTGLTCPENSGSLGAGISLTKGISTTVKIYDDLSKNYKILINGADYLDTKVSQFVIEYYLKFVKEPVFISVDHECEIPIGYGLGSSGAAALGLSFALNDALKMKLSPTQTAQIAHQADFICKTGLGTVISEFTGGFEIRTSIGGPGIGKILKFPISNDFFVVILCLKPISTKSILDKSLCGKNDSLNLYSKTMIKQLIKNPDIDTFLNTACNIAKKFGLFDGPCREPALSLQKFGIKSSVALFGHTLFTIVKKEQISLVLNTLDQFDGKIFVCNIDNYGARLF